MEIWFPRVQSLLGVFAFAALAWLLAERRQVPSVRLCFVYLASIFSVALLFTHVPMLVGAVRSLTAVANALKSATLAGTSFVFGHVGGAETPFEVTNPSALFSFGFQALPLLILLSGLANVLFHWGVLRWIIERIGGLINRLFRVGGAVGLTAGANLIFGPAESALLIRPYLKEISRSQLFAVLTLGTSTVSGTVLVLYASVLSGVNDAVLGHVVIASLMSLPAGLFVASLMLPPDSGREDSTPTKLSDSPTFSSTGDAFARGITDGAVLFVSILAAVFAFIALVALIDIALAAFPVIGGEELTLARMVGWVCAPLAWLAGTSWSEASAAGQLIGTKVVLNELIAYVDMSNLRAEALSDRSTLIMIYSLCGFANIGSVGLLISGFGTLAPNRRLEVIRLAPRAVLSGTLASLMTGAAIGTIT